MSHGLCKFCWTSRPRLSIANVLCRSLAVLALGSASLTSFAQRAYFADGYHGGVYGHYPKWVTRFMVDELESHPEWKLNLEIEPVTWDWARTNTPEDYAAFKKLVETSSGRIEFVNPAYGQPYLWNISGESMIRQFSAGLDKLHEHFPNAQWKTYCSEEPCFTSALPGILKSFGVEYAVLKNPNTCWGGYVRAHGGELVNWVGPDGTGICTVPRYEFEDFKPDSAWETIASNNDHEYLSAALKYGMTRPVGMCLQDAGWRNGPWIGDGRNKSLPSDYVTWSDYISATASNKPPSDNWRVSQEDIQVSLVWGAQILQRLAQQVRGAETRLLAAEKMATLAAVYKSNSWPQTNLDEAWRNLFLSQHHDCWIVPYNGRRNHSWADNVATWTGETVRLSVQLTTESMTALGARSSKKPNAARVFNTLGTGRSGIVNLTLPKGLDPSSVSLLDEENRAVPTQVTGADAILFWAEVPAMGYKRYSLTRKTRGSGEMPHQSMISEANGEYRISTGLYTITIDPKRGGAIKSLVVSGPDWASSSAIDLVKSKHDRLFNEIRGYFLDDEKFRSTAELPAKIKVIENGPLRAKLEIAGRLGRHPVIQTITVARNQPQIECGIRIDWKGSPKIGAEHAQKGGYKANDRLKAFYDDSRKLLVHFPINLEHQKVYKNAPFDVTESQLTNTFFTRWDEIKNNVILDWVDVVDGSKESHTGIALFSDHTTSYSHSGDQLSLTVQYSGMGLWGRNYTISGPSEIHYAIVPHVGTWNQAGIWKLNNEWKEPLFAVCAESRQDSERSLLDVGRSGFEVTSLKMEGQSILVRLFNAEGDTASHQIVFDTNLDRVSWVKLNGEVIQSLPVTKNSAGKSVVELALPRFGVATLVCSPANPSIKK